MNDSVLASCESHRETYLGDIAKLRIRNCGWECCAVVSISTSWCGRQDNVFQVGND